MLELRRDEGCVMGGAMSEADFKALDEALHDARPDPEYGHMDGHMDVWRDCVDRVAKACGRSEVFDWKRFIWACEGFDGA